MSGKLLLKLDATAFILQHHTAEHFAFLDDPANNRSRTSFYCTLARLLFMEDSPSKFKSFVAPLQQVTLPRTTEEAPACLHMQISECLRLIGHLGGKILGGTAALSCRNQWKYVGSCMMSVQVLVGLAAASSNGVMALRAAVQRQTVIGLLRDLRGITQATSSKRTYSETQAQLLTDMRSPSRKVTSAQHSYSCALACPATSHSHNYYRL